VAFGFLYISHSGGACDIDQVPFDFHLFARIPDHCESQQQPEQKRQTFHLLSPFIISENLGVQ
jgi:hypothetical protein